MYGSEVKRMDNFKPLKVIKGLIVMLTNRVEELEKRIDRLENEQRASSIQEFKESQEYFNKELNELNDLI